MIVFGVLGVFSMSAAMFSSRLIKLAEEDRPSWLASKAALTRVLLAGNLFGVIFIATLVFGFFHLIWWVPLACMFITFPVAQVMILEKLFSPGRGIVISGLIAVVGSPALWWYW